MIVGFLAGGVSLAAPPEEARTSGDVAESRVFGHAIAHVATHAVLAEGPARARLRPAALAFRQDGFRLLAADNAADPPRLRIMAPYPKGTIREKGYLLGHLSPVRAVAWSEDSRLLATIGGGAEGGAEQTLRLWNAKAMNRRSPGLRLAHGVPGVVTISPDGKLIAVGHEDGWVSLFRDRHGRQRPKERKLHDLGVVALAFSQDGTQLYSAGQPGTPRLLRVWRTSNLRPLDRDQPLPSPGGVPTVLRGLGRGKSAALLVGSDAGSVQRIDLDAETVAWTATVDGAVLRIRPVPDSGELIVCSAGSPDPAILDPASGATLPSFRARHRAAGLADAAYHAETGLVALAHTDGVVEYWRLADAPSAGQFR